MVDSIKRSFVVGIGFLILASCGNFQSYKTIELRNGRSISVSYEIQTTDQKERILFVEFTNEEPIRKESVVEADVVEIWDSLKSEAEKADIEEGLIKYAFLSGEVDNNGHRLFADILFNADRTENGKWSIRKAG